MYFLIEYEIETLTLFSLGEGMDGCDTHSVTYTDYVSKNIKVTARSPLQTVFATYTVDIINGVDETMIAISNVADVPLNSEIFSNSDKVMK